jgi:small-conductance mechanosensitive channel
MTIRSFVVLSLTLVATLATGVRLLAQAARPSPAAEAEIATAAIEVDGVVLFRVRGVSSLPAQDRARRIRDRLTAVAADPTVDVGSVRTVEEDGITRIVAGEQPIMGVVDADASLEQVGRAALAAAHASRIKQAISDYRAARTPAAERRAAIRIVVASLVLVAAIAALFGFSRWLDRFLARRLQARIHSVEIKSFEVMRAEQIWNTLRSGLLAVRTLVLLGIGLMYVGFALAAFPSTHGLSRDMVAFALAPLSVMGQGILDNIPSVVFLIVLYFVVRLVLRVVRLFFGAVTAGTVTLSGFDAEWAEPTYKIVRIAVVAFALVVAYPYIPGSETDAFRGVSLFIGIVFSLGSSTAISNIIAGYMMTYRRALKVGDRVRIGDAFGDVTHVRLQVTHVRSVKNEEIIIPNSQILAGDVINYSSLAREQGLILHTEVGIGYETPWRQVEAMLLTAADRTAGLSKEPSPFVLEKALGDFAVTYELNAFCTQVREMARLYAELHRNILDVFNEYGIQIMTPAYEGDPPEPKIVARKDWYAAPARPATAMVEEARRTPHTASTT